MKAKLLNYLKSEIDKSLQYHNVACIYISKEVLQQASIAKMLLSDIREVAKQANEYSSAKRDALATKRLCFITCKNYTHAQQL